MSPRSNCARRLGTEIPRRNAGVTATPVGDATVSRFGCCLVIGTVLMFLPGGADPAYAQSGLREALERLDVDEDGEIDAEEVTPLARPFLERILRSSRRRDLDELFEKPISIERLQEEARRYFAIRNGVSGRDVRPRGERTVKSFGRDDDESLVPAFGLSKIRFPYTQDDLDFADRTLRSHDHNKDGFIDREEAKDEDWTHRDPFADDLNKDDRLSRMEMAQRYARRRLLSDAAEEFWRRSERAEDMNRRSDRDDRDGRDDRSEWWRRGGSDYWLTASLMGRFDANRNGRLESSEASSLNIPVGRIDVDRDGEISRDELYAHIASVQNEAGGLSEGLPAWFYEYDTDKDGQVAMSEYLAEWSYPKKEEFLSLDTNGDGLLTASEVIAAKSLVGGTYRSEAAEVLPPRRTIISEIEVEDDLVIRDLNVELSITHSNVSYLDAYLTGPDGRRVELFTEVGGSGDNFEDTTFDDQSRTYITKARPPFEGSFLPEAVQKKQPSLSSFNGTNAKGFWQLIVRGTRSERFGMLHGWGLTIAPEESVPGFTPPEDEGDDAELSGEDSLRP